MEIFLMGSYSYNKNLSGLTANSFKKSNKNPTFKKSTIFLGPYKINYIGGREIQ
jgi:hypothetical protein